ncbi:hypothetical protein Tco_1405177 [Tanacetum coccineum]
MMTSRPRTRTTNEATIVRPKSVNETVVSKSKINRDEVIIEDWTSNDEDDVCADKTVSSVKPNVTQAVRSQADKSDYDFYDQKSPEPRVKNVVNTGKRIVKPVWDYGKGHSSEYWGNPEILLQDHAVMDSGCSSHMTGNKAYLSDYEDLNGGFVAFGSDPKGGKITEQMRQEEARLEEAIKLQAQFDEEVAKQIHLDMMVAKRIAEEEALSEQQKKRKAQVQFEAQFYTEEDWEEFKARYGGIIRKIAFVRLRAKAKRNNTPLLCHIQRQIVKDMEKSFRLKTSMKQSKLEDSSARLRSIFSDNRANRADTFYISFGAMIIGNSQRGPYKSCYRTLFVPPFIDDAI